MNILIVEDDKTCAELLTKFLEPYGQCQVVADGAEAFDIYEQRQQTDHKFDLICLDILMPNVDGLSALKRIREFEAQNSIKPLDAVKIIMTTSVDAPTEVLAAFKSGCEGYVVKPVQKANLLRELRKLGLV